MPRFRLCLGSEVEMKLCVADKFVINNDVPLVPFPLTESDGSLLPSGSGEATLWSSCDPQVSWRENCHIFPVGWPLKARRGMLIHCWTQLAPSTLTYARVSVTDSCHCCRERPNGDVGLPKAMKPNSSRLNGKFHHLRLHVVYRDIASYVDGRQSLECSGDGATKQYRRIWL